MQKNVASQKWTVFAFDITDNTAKTGDAGQITANIKIDGGASNSTDDTNPTELEDGYYEFDLTQAETNGENIRLFPASSTGNIQVIGVPGAVYTTPANFPDLSVEVTTGRTDVASIAGTAQTANDNGADLNTLVTQVGTAGDGLTAINLPNQVMDITGNLSGSVGSVIGHTPQTGDNFTLIGNAGVGLTYLASSANLATLDAIADSILAILDDPRSEPGQGAPAVNADMATKVDYLYKFMRNKVETGSTSIKVWDDAGSTLDHVSTISAAGSTFTRGEFISG